MTDEKEQPESPRMRPTRIYLSDEAWGLLGKLGRELYRGRPRVASQTIERLIREECERRGIKSE